MAGTLNAVLTMDFEDGTDGGDEELSQRRGGAEAQSGDRILSWSFHELRYPPRMRWHIRGRKMGREENPAFGPEKIGKFSGFLNSRGRNG